MPDSDSSHEQPLSEIIAELRRHCNLMMTSVQGLTWVTLNPHAILRLLDAAERADKLEKENERLRSMARFEEELRDA